MGIFSKKTSVEESDGYAIQALAMGILKLDEDVRIRVGPLFIAAVKKHLDNQSTYSQSHKDSTLSMFQIISGTVGMKEKEEINTDGNDADEIRDVIESTLPTDMPLMVVGAIRMVIEEYFTGKKINEIDLDKFDKHDSRQIVHAIMTAISIINERCITDPRKHTLNEVLCFAYLAKIISIHTRFHIPFK